MTATTRRWAALAGAIIVAALLAFPLRQAVHESIVVPGAYLLWVLGLIYRSLSAGIWWVILLALVLLLLGRSLAPGVRLPQRTPARARPPRGQVEDLALWLERSSHGTYFKWMVANRLGKLAYQILLQRESGKPRSVFEPLLGADWEPSPELQGYLQSGLQGSFADFPNHRRLLGTPSRTPLDHDISDAVDFLETHLEHTGRS